MVATPHGVLYRDSHEIVPTKGGGTQVDDFTKGFTKGISEKNLRRRNGGGQGDPDPLVEFIGLCRDYKVLYRFEQVFLITL